MPRVQFQFTAFLKNNQLLAVAVVLAEKAQATAVTAHKTTAILLRVELQAAEVAVRLVAVAQARAQRWGACSAGHRTVRVLAEFATLA